jgi:hypothetical protein
VIRYTGATLAMVLLAVIAQQFTPAFTGLFDSRLMLVQLVFVCTANSLPAPLMLLLAFVCGFLTDAGSVLAPHGGDPETYREPVEPLRFGYSIALHGLMGYLMQGVRPLFRRGKWQFSALLSGFAIFAYLLAEYLLINFMRGGFSLGHRTLLRMALSSGLTMLLSPLVFWAMFRLAALCNYPLWSRSERRHRPAF